MVTELLFPLGSKQPPVPRTVLDAERRITPSLRLCLSGTVICQTCNTKTTPPTEQQIAHRAQRSVQGAGTIMLNLDVILSLVACFESLFKQALLEIARVTTTRVILKGSHEYNTTLLRKRSGTPKRHFQGHIVRYLHNLVDPFVLASRPVERRSRRDGLLGYLKKCLTQSRCCIRTSSSTVYS